MTTTAGPEQTPMDQLKESTDNNSLKKVIDEIKQLTDGNDNNNIELDGVLTTEFKNSLTSENAQILLDELNKITPAPDDPGFKDLKDFLEMVCATNPLKTGTTIDEGLTTGNEASDKAKKLIKVSRDMVDGIIGAENFSKAPDTLKTQLINIKTILENPTKANIQELQKFLYEHVSDKNTFLDKNKDKKTKPNPAANGTVTWDGLFGDNTKVSLNKFLSDAEKYIKEYGEGVSVEKTHNTKAAEQAAEAEKKAIDGVTTKINEITDDTITVSKVEEALTAYDHLTETQKAKIGTDLKTKLDGLELKCKTLKTKLEGIKSEMQTVFTAKEGSEQVYELTKLFDKGKLTKDEAKMLSNETNKETILSQIPDSTERTALKNNNDKFSNLKNNIEKALENIINGMGTNPDTDPAKSQEELRRNAEAQQSFDELQTELSKLNKPDINQALNKITPLNDKLKQGRSIDYLKAERIRLINKIKGFGGEDVVFEKKTGKITTGMENKDKKGHRQEINRLEKELMKVYKELNEKVKIKAKILDKKVGDEWALVDRDPEKPEDPEYLGKIKTKLKNVNGQDYYLGLTDKYEKSLDYIGENKPIEVEDAPTNDPEDPEAPEDQEDQDNADIPAEGAPSQKASPESVRRSTQSLGALLENLKTAFEQFKEGKFWQNLALLLDAFSGKTTTKESDSTKTQIDLASYTDSDIKNALDAINKIENAFNGRKEIIEAINSKNKNKIKSLQRKLWTFPITENGTEKKSEINITGEIDKATAEALKSYADAASKEQNQNNDNKMPYAFCTGYEKVQTKIAKTTEIYKNKAENDNTYIMIKIDSSGNIESITRGELAEGQEINGETSNVPTFNTENTKVYALGTGSDNNTTIVEGTYTVPDANPDPAPGSQQQADNASQPSQQHAAPSPAGA